MYSLIAASAFARVAYSDDGSFRSSSCPRSSLSARCHSSCPCATWKPACRTVRPTFDSRRRSIDSPGPNEESVLVLAACFELPATAPAPSAPASSARRVHTLLRGHTILHNPALSGLRGSASNYGAAYAVCSSRPWATPILHGMSVQPARYPALRIGALWLPSANRVASAARALCSKSSILRQRHDFQH